MEQRTLEWHRMRWGKFTGSEIGKLMGKGRKKDDLFSQTGKGYINEKVTELTLADGLLDDDQWLEDYLMRTNVTSKAMQYGIDQEPMAKQWFSLQTGLVVEELGSVAHEANQWFCASPDGMVEINGKKYILEIKCPEKAKFAEYFRIKNADDLKAVNDMYYWQMQAEMACTCADGGLFIAYRGDQSAPMHVAVIDRNEEAIKEMLDKIDEAWKLVQELKGEMLNEDVSKVVEIIGKEDIS